MKDLLDYIEKSRQGDAESYRMIVRSLGLSVRAFVASRISDFHAVEDISQDVFISAYQSLHNFDMKADFRNWLLGITRHKVNDYLKRHYSQKNFKASYEIEIQNILEPQNSLLDDVSQERLSQLQACLQKLPEAARDILTARYFNNETVISLAERLESSENAISSKLFRLKQKLRNCIGTA